VDVGNVENGGVGTLARIGVSCTFSAPSCSFDVVSLVVQLKPSLGERGRVLVARESGEKASLWIPYRERTII
jgi:hypothetical protein